MNEARFNRHPVIHVKGNYNLVKGWEDVFNLILKETETRGRKVVIETYQGVYLEELLEKIELLLKPDRLIYTPHLMKAEEEISQMVYPDVTDDRIFGFMTRLSIKDYFPKELIQNMNVKKEKDNDFQVIVGPGASLFAPENSLLVYADMARWEIQLRMRKHEVDNLGLKNRKTEDWMLLYKQGYFVDWRVCDRLKKELFEQIDFVLDTNDMEQPKMIENRAITDAYKQAVNQPFSVVPFFDPGPWGGQWMKEVCNLDPEKENYAWCFNCVPEENSLLLDFGTGIMELPSINLVFRHPVELLGDPVHARFGDEFPIRFDFLDTMEGGNLSLQVHPTTEYIRENFGLNYTQDESYYLMDAKAGAKVFLGLKDGVSPEEFVDDLNKAQEEGSFEAEKHVETWPAEKHDHFLIPAGTVHCSGKDSMVLEISATPYIFTFKLWDWGRLGLDGKPRPINLEHGRKVIQWNRTTRWTRKNLVNRVEKVGEGDNWMEEKTGLHEREFLETRRHWFSGQVNHKMKHGVEVMCLVEGDEIIVESPQKKFEAFVVHYAEVFIIPSAVGEYTVRPHGSSEGSKCATLKAFVRS